MVEAIQLPLALRIADHARFDTFVGAANETAMEHVRAVASGRADTLWLWGSPGSGKTHLLQAACRAAAAADRRAMYLALHLGLEPEILGGLDAVDLLALDGVDRIAGAGEWERALFVLARSDSPQARAEVTRVAMGSSNPDLQMKAVEYLAVSGDKKDSATFTNIYRSTSDPSVKRAALQALFMRKDENALVTLARSETNEDLRRQAIQLLGAMRAAGPLASLYSSEKSPDVRRSIIDALFTGGDAKQLVSLARSESNPELKRQAVERLSMMHSKDADAYLMELLNK